jgi:hypothetical protein
VGKILIDQIVKAVLSHGALAHKASTYPEILKKEVESRVDNPLLRPEIQSKVNLEIIKYRLKKMEKAS